MRTYTSRLAAVALLFGTLLFAGNAVQAQTTNEMIPLNMNVFIPCANGGEGEIVSLSGTLHILTHVSTNAAGCTVVKTHAQPTQLSGVGSVSGATYQGTGATQQTVINRVECGEGCTVELNYNNNYRMIGQGPGNNYMVHVNRRVIYNYCTMEMTVVSENISIECL